MRPRSLALALAAGLALADGSIVTLALPEIRTELDTTVEGVAAVIGVYTLVLALALLPLERLGRRVGLHVVGAGGLGLMALASIVCALAGDVTTLLIARGAQALGGAGGLVAAFALIGGGADGHGRRAWVTAAVLGTAIGPALGGALTQAFSWSAIFVFQAPVAAIAAVACLAAPVHPPAVAGVDVRFAWRPALGLALVSAALSAVLFLLVLLLVAGWSVSPLRAALAVTVIPLGALIGARIHGDPWKRASAGSALIGGGVLALAWLPDAHLAWTIAPQALAGVGMGLALTALGGDLLPERTPHDAARVLGVRHAGIAVILAVLAPLAADRLDAATRVARERGVAAILDARLAPQDKLAIAPRLLDGVRRDDPRAGLRAAVAAQRSRFAPGSARAEYDRLGARADDTLVNAVGEAFRTSFIVAGLAGLAAAALLARVRTSPAVVGVALGLAVPAPLAYALAHRSIAASPPAIRDPCDPRALPRTPGVDGFVQDRLLELLDDAACRYGSSREELLLALLDADDARRFQERHGVDVGALGGVLSALLGR